MDHRLVALDALCPRRLTPESADPPLPAGVIDALGELPPPTVPWVEEPPVAAKPDRAPAAKLWRMELEAEPAARRTAPAAARQARCAADTGKTGAATPAAPD